MAKRRFHSVPSLRAFSCQGRLIHPWNGTQGAVPHGE